MDVSIGNNLRRLIALSTSFSVRSNIGNSHVNRSSIDERNDDADDADDDGILGDAAIDDDDDAVVVGRDVLPRTDVPDVARVAFFDARRLVVDGAL